MYRCGRPVKSKFSPEENLFLRCEKHQVEGLNLIPATCFSFPVFSVNRGKFSEPGDVLLPKYLNWGIAKFQVQDISLKISSNEKTEYTFHAVHVPEEENYSHSEVGTNINGKYNKRRKIQSQKVKKEFRMHLAQRALVIQQPNT